MSRATRWARAVLAAMLPLLMLGTALLPAGPVNAEFCVEMPQLAAPALQAQEQWRYTWDGAGGYGLVGWNSAEATFLAVSQGCLIHTLGMVNIDLRSGSERWRLTADWLEGEASTSAAAGSGLIFLPTTEGLYAFDDSTGEQRWGYRHDYEGHIPDIVAIENDIIVLAETGELTGIDIGTGEMAWEQRSPVGQISDWESIEDGPLVALGYTLSGGPNVEVFGLDPSTGELLWQTAVGQTTIPNSTLNLAGHSSGLIAAEVITDTTSALVTLDGQTGAIAWTVPLARAGSDSQLSVTNGAQPVIVYANGRSFEEKLATGYDLATGAVRWQNETIGADAILADDTHLVGAGPTPSELDALVLVDGETGEMIWAQDETRVSYDFRYSALVLDGELIFLPLLPKESAPAIAAVDLGTGTVNWSNSYPEFAWMNLVGTAAGIVMATGVTPDEAVLIGLAS